MPPDFNPIAEHHCYDCEDKSQVQRPAVMQLCGRWLCQEHLNYWQQERGIVALRAIQQILRHS